MHRALSFFLFVRPVLPISLRFFLVIGSGAESVSRDVIAPLRNLVPVDPSPLRTRPLMPCDLQALIIFTQGGCRRVGQESDVRGGIRKVPASLRAMFRQRIGQYSPQSDGNLVGSRFEWIRRHWLRQTPALLPQRVAGNRAGSGRPDFSGDVRRGQRWRSLLRR